MGFLSAFQSFLELVNVVFSSGIVIFSCAFLIYIAIYHPRNSVARSFAILLACVLLTYFVDLALSGVENLDAAVLWLRLQWVGIAFTPAAYLDFSGALLTTTGARSRSRNAAVRLCYLLSGLLLLGVAFGGDIVVRDSVLTHHAPHLLPGPLFLLFVLYFFVAIGWGAANVLWARRRCLTSTSRRRMTYLAATFAAPAAGVFPYLLLTGWPSYAPSIALWLLLVLGNVGIALMLLMLAYSVTFFGGLTPDRVVKRRLARFLLRGPFAAILLVVVIVVVSQAEGWLGLPGRRLVYFGVVVVVFLLQVGIELTKPLLDRALYRQDYPEVKWMQGLIGRLLTTSDLRQFLENVLTALCDLLRVETAFVAIIDGGRPRLEVVCGPLEPEMADQLLSNGTEMISASSVEPPKARRLERHGNLFTWDGYWLAPLRAKGQDVVVGVVGVAARAPEPDLSPEEQEGMEALLAQAAAALEDRQLQQAVFGALEQIIPEIDDIQRRRGVVHYVGERALSGFDLAEALDFRQWVRDALSHYWGGPKLTASPLLGLHVVERAVWEHDGNVIKGLRTVLEQAIERLRPDGKRQMTAPEWILYNILELKFLQGRKVREIALRLAMSESDLYRKQRVAIEAVAQTLAEMEREELGNREDGSEEAG